MVYIIVRIAKVAKRWETPPSCNAKNVTATSAGARRTACDRFLPVPLRTCGGSPSMRGDAESDMPGNDGETAGGRSAMFLGAVPDEPGEGGKSGNERLFRVSPKTQLQVYPLKHTIS